MFLTSLHHRYMDIYNIVFLETCQFHPMSDTMRQILILRYLTSVGESPELMVHMYDQINVLGLILKFIDVDAAIKDPRLSLEALKFLGALLSDKKFPVDFIYGQGLHRLIEVPRPSIAATVNIFLIT